MICEANPHATVQEIEMLKSGPLRKLLGNITHATLQAWLDCDAFPQPIVRNGYHFWFAIEVREWLHRQPRRKPAGPVAA